MTLLKQTSGFRFPQSGKSIDEFELWMGNTIMTAMGKSAAVNAHISFDRITEKDV